MVFDPEFKGFRGIISICLEKTTRKTVFFVFAINLRQYWRIIIKACRQALFR